MKLKITFLALIALCTGLNAGAKQVSIDEAEKIARNFIYITINKYDDGISFDRITLADPYIHQVDGKAVFYAFQMNPGFIIVSADDLFTPVIGYSFNGRFDLAGASPNYRGFILNYADQITFARQNNVPASAEVNAAWAELRTDQIEAVSVTRDRDVEPLVSSLWDQGDPYNYYCPADAAGPGGHTWVGCVATAMAQIMYYWRYPLNGTGDHCYIPGNYSYGEQCADYANTYYQWDGMINSVDDKNPYGNAELQYHCAVSVNMNFNPNGSGAQSSNVPNALNQYFRYNSAQYREKGNYTLSGWIALLKADIDVGKPVYYSGYSPSEGGHAFVCDGYQGDNFHFNFGWSGYGNGYYSLSDVFGFYQGQACVRNFAPSDVNYPYINTGSITVTNTSGSITDGSGPVEDYTNNINAFWLIDPQSEYDSINNITISFSQFDLGSGDSVKVFNGESINSPLLGAYGGTNMPPSLTTTGNKMLVQFKTNGSGTGSGWYAEYSTTSPTWCQGLVQYTEPTGTFDDGSGEAFYYQNGATCMWRIKPPYANKIILTFNYFDTEEGIDKLNVYDGTTLLAELSGNELPDPIEATSGSIFMTWSTNINTTRPGWEIYYEVDNIGISENSPVTELSVFPNPANDKLHVEFNINSTEDLKIKLVNITGQTLYSETHPGFSGNYQNEIAVGSLPAGMYFLEINAVTGTANKKIFINR
ncbi:MAG TPA: C10 family peptidase [Bacteroidales bacterium]|nr:C10 family peptidase [Bacteroidales bacterium]